MIELKNVSLVFDGRQVLTDLSLVLPEKGILLITGPSGCGKTSVARMILGLLSPTEGEVSVGDLKIAAVFQEDRLVPTLTALENVALVSDAKEAEKRLSQVGLGDALELLPEELSGGMKRRVAIARALAFSGDVLLLDEAFTGLDDELAEKILKELCEEFKDRLIIAVTHRPELFSGREYTEIKM